MAVDPESIEGGEQFNLRVNADVMEVVEFLAFCDYRLGQTGKVFRSWLAKKMAEEDAHKGNPSQDSITRLNNLDGDLQWNIWMSSEARGFLETLAPHLPPDKRASYGARLIIAESIREEAPSIRKLLKEVTGGREDDRKPNRLDDILNSLNRLSPPEE